MLTAYDAPSARLADEAGLDILLVGDSVGMVVLGYDSTTPVSMDEMVHHCKAVARGASRPFLVGDLPFGSYLTPEDATKNATTLIKEGGMDCVKLEGGRRLAGAVQAISDAGINVCGHIGLTPQTAASLGGYRVQGKSAAAAEELLADARALEESGACAVVLECVPDRIAAYITASLRIPTIGIGAGPDCSGQVLVLHDVLGMYDKHQPKFSRRYFDGSSAIRSALAQYVSDVSEASFPSVRESFPIADEQYDDFIQGQIHAERSADAVKLVGAAVPVLSTSTSEDVVALQQKVEFLQSQLQQSQLQQQVEILQSQVRTMTEMLDSGSQQAEKKISRSPPKLLESLPFSRTYTYGTPTKYSLG